MLGEVSNFSVEGEGSGLVLGEVSDFSVEGEVSDLLVDRCWVFG